MKHSTNYLYTVMSVAMEVPDPLGKPSKVTGEMACRIRILTVIAVIGEDLLNIFDFCRCTVIRAIKAQKCSVNHSGGRTDRR